jgi:hypothetical protein
LKNSYCVPEAPGCRLLNASGMPLPGSCALWSVNFGVTIASRQFRKG